MQNLFRKNIMIFIFINYVLSYEIIIVLWLDFHFFWGRGNILFFLDNKNHKCVKKYNLVLPSKQTSYMYSLVDEEDTQKKTIVRYLRQDIKLLVCITPNQHCWGFMATCSPLRKWRPHSWNKYCVQDNGDNNYTCPILCFLYFCVSLNSLLSAINA
jgi:hypothetical protein